MISVFLLTPLREGRPSRPCSDVLAVGISTHAPAGGATMSCRPKWASPAHFYSRPCGRGDFARPAMPQQKRQISTHAPAGGATVFRLHRPFSHTRFLLTPLREGRQVMSDPILLALSISTHAPAGGATEGLLGMSQSDIISTHAPAGGATQRFCTRCLRTPYFYSRPCGRGDSNFPQVRHEVLRQIAER